MDTTTDTDIGALLATFVTSRLGADAGATVERVERVAVGRSRENWLFDVVSRRDGGGVACEPLIARRDPLGGLLETDRATEFAVLAALEATDVPAPRPRWLDADGSELGRPTLVMVREPGECDYYVLGSEDRPLARRLALARRLSELMAIVHAVDWRRIGLGDVLGDPGPDAGTVAVEGWREILRRDRLEPWPDLDRAADWLSERAPRSDATVLVHGDVKAGNVLLEGGEDRLVALLDWELAHLGDRHEDLGWVTQPLRTREHLIPGAWDRADLLAHYEHVTGHTVDHDAVTWWNVLATFKTAVMQVSGLRAYTEGRCAVHYRPTSAVLGCLRQATTSS